MRPRNRGQKVSSVILDAREEIHVGGLLHLLDIFDLNNFLIVEHDPGQIILPRQCLANKSDVVPVTRQHIYRRNPSSGNRLPCVNRCTLVADN